MGFHFFDQYVASLDNFSGTSNLTHFFFQTITVVRNVIQKFHESHLGSSELMLALESCKITRGLEAIGKTRFGTVIHGTRSVSSCRPAIASVVERDNFDLGVSYSLWMSGLSCLPSSYRNIKNTFN